MIVLGTAPPPPPLGTVYNAVAAMPKTGLPELERYRARDGSQLAYRRYEGSDPDKVAILIHGSTGEGSNMHLMAETLLGTGTTVYTLDIRGHGQSGRRGDIDYRANSMTTWSIS